MKKRKLSQGFQCITKYLKITSDSDSKEERIPAEDPIINNQVLGTQTVNKEQTPDSTETEETDMQPWRGGGFPQRGRLPQNYYNAREERLMQSRGQGYQSYDRRYDGYGDQYQQGRGNRYYYDNQSRYGEQPYQHREEFHYSNRQRHFEMPRSHSYDSSQRQYDPYDHRRINERRGYDNKYQPQGKGDDPRKDLSDKKDKVQESSDKKPAEIPPKSEASPQAGLKSEASPQAGLKSETSPQAGLKSETSPQAGFNVYQSDAYFSAGGSPEIVRDSKVSTPSRNVRKLSPRTTGNRISPKISSLRRQESAPSNLVTIPLQDKMDITSSNLVNIPLTDCIKDPSDSNVKTPLHHNESSKVIGDLVSIPLVDPGCSTALYHNIESSPVTMTIQANDIGSASDVPVPMQDVEVAPSTQTDQTDSNPSTVSGPDKMDVNNVSIGRESVTSSETLNIQENTGEECVTSSETQNVPEMPCDSNNHHLSDDKDIGSPKLKLDVINTDKMDFSTIKRALNEVKTKELGLHRKSSETAMSPRHTEQDIPEILSPRQQPKQRSAFNIVTHHDCPNTPSSKLIGLEIPPDLLASSPRSAFSPSGRKRSQSGEQITPKLISPGLRYDVDPDRTSQDSCSNKLKLSSALSPPAWNPLETPEKKTTKQASLDLTPSRTCWTPSDTVSPVTSSVASKYKARLKSASSYAEWKKIKAEEEKAIQKEKDKKRSCLEMANTPEEYRKLLKMQQEKKTKEKEKPDSLSEPTDHQTSSTEPEEEEDPQKTETMFMAIQDQDSGSDENIDLDESDDDLEAPSFLFSLEEASNRPIPGTPTKLTGFYESPGPCSPAPEPDLTDITKSTLLSSKFSLDQLVSERYDKSVDQREYEEMHADLEEGLKKGGFVKDTLENPEHLEDCGIEDILPEHEKHLQKFQIEESEICEVHPGEVIFQPLMYCHLFDETISPQSCGFQPGASYIDKYLSTLQPKYYSLLLTSNILKNTLENVSCVEAVLTWTFLLMSVDSNQLVSQGCEKVLTEHLNREVHFRDSPQTWAPSIQDILAVFCNYGCEIKTLLPECVTNSSQDYSSSLIHQEQNGVVPGGGHYSLRNLHLVLNTLAQVLHARPRYSNKELTDLLIILCNVALDRSHNSEILPYEFQVCFRGILRNFTSNYWEEKCNELCHIVFRVTSHHHNRLYLSQLLPEDKRGGYLQKRLAFLCLQDMFEAGRDVDIQNYKIKCLHMYLPCLHNLVYTDVYKLSSAISFLDIAVGNSAIKLTDKEDLQYLCDQLKKISGDIKDSVRMLDRSWVKDMMVRVCSKWTLYLLSVGSKQKSMFAYAKKKTPVEIKTVQAFQGDESSQSDEDDSKYSSIVNDNQSSNINNSGMDTMEDKSSEIHSRVSDSNSSSEEQTNDHRVAVKSEKPDVIPLIDCGSPMEVDLTEDDLPDLLDHS